MTRQEENELCHAEWDKAERIRRDKFELQGQQFLIQSEQMRIDEAEQRRTELMLEYKRARNTDEEVWKKLMLLKNKDFVKKMWRESLHWN